jgi:hypothetical protein
MCDPEDQMEVGFELQGFSLLKIPNWVPILLSVVRVIAFVSIHALFLTTISTRKTTGWDANRLEITQKD